MPLTPDWTTDTASVSAAVSIQHHTSSPLVGNRSLRMNVTTGGTTGTKGAGAVFLATPLHTRGFVMGKLRTIIRIDSDVDHAGIFCMASQATGIAGAGSCYTFGPGGSTNEVELRKLNGGLYDDTPSILATGELDLGDSPTGEFALQLEWKADLDLFGGTQLVGKVSTDVTFADIDDNIVFSIVDESSPLLNTTAEGLFLFRSGVGEIGQAIFDNTTVYETTLA